MAQDLNKLQQILQNAELNEVQLAAARKQMAKIESMVSELATILDPSHKVEPKVRKAGSSGNGSGGVGNGRRGRPRKEAAE